MTSPVLANRKAGWVQSKTAGTSLAFSALSTAVSAGDWLVVQFARDPVSISNLACSFSGSGGFATTTPVLMPNVVNGSATSGVAQHTWVAKVTSGGTWTGYSISWTTNVTAKTAMAYRVTGSDSVCPLTDAKTGYGATTAGSEASPKMPGNQDILILALGAVEAANGYAVAFASAPTGFSSGTMDTATQGTSGSGAASNISVCEGAYSATNPSSGDLSSSPGFTIGNNYNSAFHALVFQNAMNVAASGSREQSFEGGTSGNTITIGDSQAQGSTAFDAITIGADMTFRYSTAQKMHGSKGAEVVIGSTVADIFAAWTPGVNVAQYGRIYGRYPVGNSGIQLIALVDRAGRDILGVSLQNDGSVYAITPTGSTQVISGSYGYSNSWWRFELGVSSAQDGSGIFATIKLFSTADSSSPSSTWTITDYSSFGFFSQPARIEYVGYSNSVSYTGYIDDCGWSNQGWLGPASAGPETCDVSGNAKLKKFTTSGSGEGNSAASGDAKLKKFTITAEGGPSEVTAAISMKKMSVSGAGAGLTAASGGTRMKKFGTSGAGAGITAVSGGLSSKKMTVSGASAGITAASGGPASKKMSVSVSGSGTSAASGGSALKKMSISGSGSHIPMISAAINLKKMGVSGSGEGDSSGSGGLNLRKMAVAGEGSVFFAEESQASIAISLKKMSASGSGEGYSEVSSITSLKKMGVSGSSAGITVVSGSMNLEKMGIAGSGAGLSDVSGGSTLKKMMVSASGAGSSDVSGGSGLKKMAVAIEASAYIEEEGIFSGGPNLKKMSVSGSGEGSSTVSAGPGLKKMTVSASVTGTSDASGGSVLKKMSVSSSVAGISSISGESVLKKMGVSGSGAGLPAVSGGSSLKKFAVTVSGAGLSDISAGPKLKKLVITSSGEAFSDVSAGPGLKKLVIDASGPGHVTELSELSGDVLLKKMRPSASLTVFIDLAKFTSSEVTISGESGPWTNPGNARADDTSFATAAPARNAWYGNDFRGFDFSEIPDDATINLVTVDFVTKESGTATVSYRSQAYDGATTIGNQWTATGLAGSTTEKARNYTIAPTVAQLKSATFGIRFEYTRTTTTANTGNLDFIRVTVNYSPAFPGLSEISGGPALKKMIADGSGEGHIPPPEFSGGPVLKKIAPAGTGSGISVISGGPGLKKMGSSGAVTGISDGLASSSLKKMRVSGTGSGVAVLTGDPHLKKMSVAGSGAGHVPSIPSLSGDVRLKKMGVSISSQGISGSSGALRLRKMRLAGSADGISVVSGVVRSRKIIFAGTGEGISDLSGNVMTRKMRVHGEEARRPADDMFVFSIL